MSTDLLSKELPDSYKNALKGLKAQAIQATKSITEGCMDKKVMREAQVLMSKNRKECQNIYEIVRSLEVPIPVLTEADILDYLILFDLRYSHLGDVKPYYTGIKHFSGRDFYFITQYFDDLDACCGHSSNLKDALQFGKDAIYPNKFIPLNKESSDVDEFCKSLKRPDLASYFSLIERS